MATHVRQHNFLILPLFLLITVSLAANLQAAQPDDIAISVKRNSVTSKPKIPLTSEEEAWLSEHKILRVAGPKAFPPFYYYEKDGAVKGIAYDYIRFIMEQLGVEMEIQRNLPWPDVLRKARKKEIDVISCAAKSAEREAYLSFSNPYLTFPFVIISRRDGPFISGIDDLHGIKVSLIKKVSTYEWLKRDKIDVIPHFVNTPLEGLKAVSVGLADAYIGNLAAVSYMIEKNGLANLKIAAPTPYGDYNLYFAVRKDWPQLVFMINKALGAMTPEEHAAIRNRLLPVRYEHGIRKADILKWVLGISGISVLIFMLILFWNRTLRREIRERKQAEEALRGSEEKYRTILESIEDAYFEIDIAGNFTFFNDSLCEMLGYSKDELMGMNNRQYTDKESAKELYQTFNSVYTTGKPDKGFDWKIIRKDGTERSVEASVSLRPDAKGKPIGFRGIVRDISEKKRLEDQLQQVTKMEAIATLAGGVAHEFNNALMGVMGNIELLKIDLPEDERRDKYFEAMESASHRMSRLTAQLLAYAEGGKYQPKGLKLDDFVIETVPILQHDLSPEVRVETHFSKDISHIKADHTQMQMVLSATLANSNEAIEDEGLIRITAENKDIDEDFTKQHPGLKPGPYVCLTIEDNGKGMDEETRSGIFEPFFTTKFQGRGMGMAAVYGIIRSHDGAIIVDSEPGKGTVVRIYLPAISAESKQEAKAVKPKTEITKGEGTILVIEDEEPLVDLYSQILERLGYRALLARTGKEAIELAKTFDGQIDLALLDIKLPDMDGGRVYPLIMEARPDLKVIVCSGYSIHGPAQAILDVGAEGFIQKPFSIAPFAEKLKEVLEGK
jgi:two-component system, cell cycle sensor histidine kinase and response regulator CckA